MIYLLWVHIIPEEWEGPEEYRLIKVVALETVVPLEEEVINYTIIIIN